MDLGRAVESLGKALGLRSDLFARMSIEDDWSFVIKAQAILEAALTHFNTGRVNNAAVSKVLESLTVRGQRASKLALFVALVGRRRCETSSIHSTACETTSHTMFNTWITR